MYIYYGAIWLVFTWNTEIPNQDKINWRRRAQSGQIDTHWTNFQEYASIWLSNFNPFLCSQKSWYIEAAPKHLYFRVIKRREVFKLLPPSASKPSQWLKKKNLNSTFLCKNWVKSKWSPFDWRLNANKHDPALHVVKLQNIPSNDAGLLELKCKWKWISSIYIGQALTPGTTSFGSGKAGLSLSVWIPSISVSLFPNQQCEN